MIKIMQIMIITYKIIIIIIQIITIKEMIITIILTKGDDSGLSNKIFVFQLILVVSYLNA